VIAPNPNGDQRSSNYWTMDASSGQIADDGTAAGTPTSTVNDPDPGNGDGFIGGAFHPPSSGGHNFDGMGQIGFGDPGAADPHDPDSDVTFEGQAMLARVHAGQKL